MSLKLIDRIYCNIDKKVGMDKLPPNVSGSRWAIYECYGRGKNPYISPTQWRCMESNSNTDPGDENDSK